MDECTTKNENALKDYEKKIDRFPENVEKLVSDALDIWIAIAKRADLKLEKVDLTKKAREEILFLESVGKEILVSLPHGERAKIKKIYTGWPVFVDFTSSTAYFSYENYTGFVMFNSFNMLMKSFLSYLNKKHKIRFSYGNPCCEFLEHTGDGAFLYFDNRFKVKQIKEILVQIFALSEFLKVEARNRNCIEIEDYQSLIHIGAAYGKGIIIDWAGERKFISAATWQAAKNCKEAGKLKEVRCFLEPVRFFKFCRLFDIDSNMSKCKIEIDERSEYVYVSILRTNENNWISKYTLNTIQKPCALPIKITELRVR